MLATCYPEAVSRIYILNTPSYFSIVWSVVKSFIDPRTAEKLILVAPTDTYSTLSSIIDDANIPELFGRTFEFRHGMAPILDETILASLNWIAGYNYPSGPVKVTEKDGEIVLIAVGEAHGEKRHDAFASWVRSSGPKSHAQLFCA